MYLSKKSQVYFSISPLSNVHAAMILSIDATDGYVQYVLSWLL